MSEDKPETETQTGAARRLDGLVYQLEQGVITGSLLLMTLTYFLQIVHREMQVEVNVFDKWLLRWQGFDSIGAARAVEGTVEVTTQIYTPIFLTFIALVMAMLALRTRERSSPTGETSTPRSLPAKLALSVVLTGATYGLLSLVAVIPSRWLCLLSVTAMTGLALRVASQEGRWAGAMSALLGGGLAAWFFIARVEDGYIWASELSSLLLMYVGFLGASMATKEGRHIQVDAIRKGLSTKYLPLYNGIGNVITVLFCALLLAMTLFYMGTTLEAGNQLEATELPEVIMALPIAICLALMCLRFSARGAQDLKRYLRGQDGKPLSTGGH